MSLMKQRSHIFRIIVATWVMLSVLISGTSGMVLCIGENGRIAIEPVHHDKYYDACDSEESNTSPTPLSQVLADTHGCRTCMDIVLSPNHPLHSTAPGNASRSISQTIKHATAMTLTYSIDSNETAPQGSHPDMHPRPSPHLGVQRVTILRT